jgi:hypothetical protein
MTATVLEFRPRTARGPAPLIRTRYTEPTPAIVDAPAWWSCPSWCDPDECIGGQTFRYDNGRVQTSHRTHVAVVYAAGSEDGVGHEVSIRVIVAVTEDADDGWLDPPTVEVDAAAVLDPDTAVDFADAVVRAAVIARQPLPTITRSLSHGGGRASTPQAAS